MRWFVDDSDIRSIDKVKVPNIILIGGIVVRYDNQKNLRDSIEKIKKKYGNNRAPVKWNFKDLKSKYKEANQYELWSSLLNNMESLRSEIFSELENHDFSVIISCVKGYSSKKNVLNELKDDLTRMAFSNGLMRYGLHVQQHNPSFADVLIDWPDKNLPKPFDDEYNCAYNKGKSFNDIDYHCGSLSSINFNDSIIYTKTLHSTLMQISDMILGVTREFIQYCIDSERKRNGLDLMGNIKKKFRGYPDNVINRGVIFNRDATDLKISFKKKFKEL